jgi:hypothetical protein
MPVNESLTSPQRRTPTCPLTCEDGSRDWTRTSNPSVSTRRCLAVLVAAQKMSLPCTFAAKPVPSLVRSTRQFSVKSMG